MTAIALGAGAEFDRIRSLAAAIGPAIGPVGDDTAGVPDGPGQLVVSTDASIEGVHFRREWISPQESGWRATGAALSDLAAAAAVPVGVLAAVIVPTGAPPDELMQVMRGVAAAAGSVGARVLGGDLTTGAEWGIVVTVLGRVERPVSRVGARPGDGVWVSGALGGSRAALEAWRRGAEPDHLARAAFVHPMPCIELAQWLARHGVTAMMDLSDGLGGDAQHLAAASQVRLEIELERLPIHPSAITLADRFGTDPVVFAAEGGEDYQLLVTMPPDFDVAELAEDLPDQQLTRIGVATVNRGVQTTLRGAVLEVHGFRHAL